MYVILKHETSTAYLDLTGQFPFPSSWGNQYLLVAYHYDTNAILVEALKNWNATTIVTSWNSLNNKFDLAGAKPQHWILDNEYSNELKISFNKEDVTWQLVPPDIHWANSTERAIQTFKKHVKAGLSLLHPKFSVREWDWLLH